jgi:2-keto-3-deoxy-L-rhamnonate aldolase RhmA
MNGSLMRQKLHTGERVYGTLIVSNSPRWPAVVNNLGLDFVFIDNEHTTLDRSQTAWMCQTYAALGLAPVVRIPSPDPYLACMALDGGAQGIIVPYTETPEQVRQIAGAVHLRPLKGAREQDALAGRVKLEPVLADYLENYNKNNLLIVNIESVPALQALDDILAVPGLDAVLVGPHDLTTNLGIPEEYRHPAYIAAVDEIIQKARARGIGAGVHAIYPFASEHELRWAKMGANLIIHQGDLISLRIVMRSALDELKQALGDQALTGKVEGVNI